LQRLDRPLQRLPHHPIALVADGVKLLLDDAGVRPAGKLRVAPCPVDAAFAPFGFWLRLPARLTALERRVFRNLRTASAGGPGARLFGAMPETSMSSWKISAGPVITPPQSLAASFRSMAAVRKASIRLAFSSSSRRLEGRCTSASTSSSPRAQARSSRRCWRWLYREHVPTVMRRRTSRSKSTALAHLARQIFEDKKFRT
jgi:hypothetical protein